MSDHLPFLFIVKKLAFLSFLSQARGFGGLLAATFNAGFIFFAASSGTAFFLWRSSGFFFLLLCKSNTG